MTLLRTTAFPLLVLAALVAGALPANAATVTVTLKVHANVTFPFNEPAFTTDGLTTCGITVNAGDNADAVLNAAVTSGCIDGWHRRTYPDGSHFITAIKGHGQS